MRPDGSNLPSDLEAWLVRFAQDHARYNSRLLFVRQAYPMEQLSRIGAGARVAIQGAASSDDDALLAELLLPLQDRQFATLAEFAAISATGCTPIWPQPGAAIFPGSRIDIDETDSTYLLTTKFSGDTVRQPIDVVVVARLEPFVPESDKSLLIRNLLKRGLAQPPRRHRHQPRRAAAGQGVGAGLPHRGRTLLHARLAAPGAAVAAGVGCRTMCHGPGR
jgi:hypothetical protein